MKGIKFPGGRLRRRSRLRKKARKFKMAMLAQAFPLVSDGTYFLKLIPKFWRNAPCS